MTRVLGIEGTAWAASAAVYDDASDAYDVETEAYRPETGGIHPREAAEHMHAALPRVVKSALHRADGVDAVAFSRGPGLGPCLRLCGTAARAVAGTLGVPLVGVNHMLAHLEVGRCLAGFDDPVGLNASGANAHVLALCGDRYRVLGETMDTGVGNAIDKFARTLGWAHPGGPKVETAAAGGEYRPLPYVVKGMDFSFAGITSAAQDAFREAAGGPAPAPAEADGDLADLCYSLQETVFAMLTEVAERALSLTGRDELVLGGGVGQNARLREMLSTMCDDRGARFFAPEPCFLADNAGMIALLGSMMYAAGDTIPIEDSRVRPDFRPDDVPVTWRESGPTPTTLADAGPVRGAEAVVEVGADRVRKRRRPKAYRHADLDARLRRERTAIEARLTHEARRLGVPTPVVYDLDPAEATVVFERVGEADLRDRPSLAALETVGRWLARLHGAGFVHGDPTTRNVRVGDRIHLIDFGLGFHTNDVEDFAMDLHVLAQSLGGTVTDPDGLRAAAERGYLESGDPAVVDRLREIETRGRYRSAPA